jgi:hypothetical protein
MAGVVPAIHAANTHYAGAKGHVDHRVEPGDDG